MSTGESKKAIQELTPEEKRQRLGQLLRQRAQQQVRRFPLSFAQQRLWFLDQMEGGSTSAYTIPIVLRLKGSVEAALIECSINQIIRRHETLRTTFGVNASGTPEQLVHPWEPFQLGVLDISGDADPWRSAREESVAEARTPFDLLAGPLFRARLLKLGFENWVLLLTMHHIISDGWSVNVIINELAALYDSYSKNLDSPLKELPVQYSDFAHWQRQRLTEDVLDPQMAYWRQQLGSKPPILELPTLGPRPKVHSLAGAVHVWRINRKASEAALKISRAEGVTLFMTLMAGFNVLLHRYSGQGELFVGTPIANRNRREIEGLIGLFINTLVFRTDLSADPTVRELLKAVKQTALGAYAHQDVPFEKLVDELQPERDISRTPLFQVMLVLQPPMPQWNMTDIRITPWVIEGSTSKFDMTLSIVEESDGGLQGWIEYNSDLFDGRMIEQFVGNFETLLLGMEAYPDQRISRLPLMSELERRQILHGWNETAADYRLDRCLHEIVEAQARQTPDSTSVIFEGQHLSYEKLDLLADALAAELSIAKVEQEEVVGICMQRSAELAVSLLAVLKAGAAYLPLDPSYPRERLHFMVQDAGVRVLLAERQSPALCNDSIGLINVDQEWAANPKTRITAAQRRVGGSNPENLAYVIYTSGSTGNPKGVMTSHRGMCNIILWMQKAFALNSNDRMLQRTAFSFDASIWEFFWPLICGATLVVAPPAASRDGDLLVQTIIETEVTILQLVQSLLQVLLEAGPITRCRTLRHVFCGGEAMAPSLPERLYSSLHEADLHNVYGPTEASMHVTHWKCPSEEADRVIPIGAPIGNSTIHILDKELEPVPIGVWGQLVIGGAGLARGYLKRPDLTAERFVPNPHAQLSAERLYLTGDLARYREDGNIEFFGRIDHQVKIRGFRIELGEIEAVLRQHGAVRQAIVVCREDTPGDKLLAAYVVPADDSQPGASELRDFLQTKLPEYMLPSAFVFLDTLPTMSSGKVDRNSLPIPDRTRDEAGEPYVPPRTEAEAKLAAIFEEVLNCTGVGANDSFFSLGGHSLSATQVITRIRDAFRVELPLRRLFELPTVAGLAAALEGAASSQDDEDRIEIISTAAVPEEKPLSSLLDDLSSEDLESLLAEIAARKRR